MKASVFARVVVLALGGLALAGCANLDDTQQRMLSGGAIGAGTGAVVTVVTGGCVACGAAIGAAVGAAGGYAVDAFDSSQSSSSNAPAGNGGYNNNSNYNNNYPPSNGYPSNNNNNNGYNGGYSNGPGT
ncbi:MAG TPA: hypothetical protein VMV79_06780 [Alphaproteobacteria bacterium]|nr:hypothetical protein [Alphaproteobacteria bacterium]